MIRLTSKSALVALALTLPLAGCADRPAGWLPNEQAVLRKTPAEFKADAKSRFPYPADASRGGDLPVRAEIGYMLNVITLVNYSHDTWKNAELWVNHKYVIGLDSVAPGQAYRIGFKLIYDANGNQLPNDDVMIDTLELKKDGMIYDVPKQIGG